MNCKIQKPVPVQQNLQPVGKHGKLKVQTICNDVPEDEIKFDATSGDIKLKLNCTEPEEYDDDWFIVDDNDLLEEIEKLKTQIEALKIEVETLKNAEKAELETINEQLEDLHEMLNSE